MSRIIKKIGGISGGRNDYFIAGGGREERFLRRKAGGFAISCHKIQNN